MPLARGRGGRTWRHRRPRASWRCVCVCARARACARVGARGGADDGEGVDEGRGGAGHDDGAARVGEGEVVVAGAPHDAQEQRAPPAAPRAAVHRQREAARDLEGGGRKSKEEMGYAVRGMAARREKGEMEAVRGKGDEMQRRKGGGA